MLKKFYDLFKARRPAGEFVGRSRTCDNAFIYRMGAGFPGDINRVHPFDAEPCQIDPTNPPTAYGQAVMVNPANNGVRPVIAGDSAATFIYGWTVRPYPTMSQTSIAPLTTVNFGGGTPPINGAIDVLRKGYIMLKLGGSAAAAKGSAVFVWVAASAGSHVQGQPEAVATAGSTIALDAARSSFNGPADANGNVEVAYNI
jgi:hypothetical protein